MKNFVQYHNTSKQGPLRHSIDGTFQIFATKSINHLDGHRVWLISGHGTRSPKQYQLEYVFWVESIVPGVRNLAVGSSGCRFTPPVVLNRKPWFRGFLRHQTNFRNGVQPIAPEHVAELEGILQECRH